MGIEEGKPKICIGWEEDGLLVGMPLEVTVGLLFVGEVESTETEGRLEGDSVSTLFTGSLEGIPVGDPEEVSVGDVVITNLDGAPVGDFVKVIDGKPEGLPVCAVETGALLGDPDNSPVDGLFVSGSTVGFLAAQIFGNVGALTGYGDRVGDRDGLSERNSVGDTLGASIVGERLGNSPVIPPPHQQHPSFGVPKSPRQQLPKVGHPSTSFFSK